MESNIVVIDLKAFYASVECVDRHLDPFLTPLVVVDKSRGPATIILSVTPYLKKQGIPSRLRLFELPKGEYIYAMPRMERYLEVSAEVVSIVLHYVNEDDIHIYSIDELFVDLTHYLKLYKKNSLDLTKQIMSDIKNKLGLTTCAGIGPNMLLAKCALDLEAKTNQNNIAYWTYKDVENKLYKVTPLSKMWGISHNLEKKLNNLGLYSVGDIANCSKGLLISKFGVMGEQLFNNARGIDNTNIREKYIPKSTSLSVGQVLNRDYSMDEMPIIIREMCDDLMLRVRLQRKFCQCVHLGILYSKNVNAKGFYVQCKLQRGTDDEDIVYEVLMNLFNKNIQNNPIRQVNISVSSLYNPTVEQLDIFIDPEVQQKKRSLQFTIDQIRNKFGQNSILRTDALSKSSNAIERHKLIGGHHR